MDKIKELTDKLYLEGVEKGNKEAERIIAEAKKQSEEILSNAQNEAAKFTENAEKDIEKKKEDALAGLKLAKDRSIETLKSEITNLITGSIVESNIKAAVDDKKFMQSMILDIAKQWAKSDNIVISTSQAKELTEYFESNAKELLNKSVTIKSINGKKSNFEISPSDSSYKISFGEKEFIEYFKEFLRPKIIEILF